MNVQYMHFFRIIIVMKYKTLVESHKYAILFHSVMALWSHHKYDNLLCRYNHLFTISVIVLSVSPLKFNEEKLTELVHSNTHVAVNFTVC